MREWERKRERERDRAGSAAEFQEHRRNHTQDRTPLFQDGPLHQRHGYTIALLNQPRSPSVRGPTVVAHTIQIRLNIEKLRPYAHIQRYRRGRQEGGPEGCASGGSGPAVEAL